MKKRQIRKKSKKSLFSLLLIMCGWYILVYPLISDRLDRLYNINTISDFQNDLAQYSDTELKQMLNNCIEYNKNIAEEQKKKPFRYRGSKATDDQYQAVPVPGSPNIGSITIPKLGLDIPISHGTHDADLQGGVGHLYGTSLPVEGKSVRSVIAGHSALSSAELFTHIDKLKKGDEFYITVLNKRYKYVVQSKTVCLPEDDWQYEQIEDNKNLATLYTCTPYGINDHRLLVTGKYAGVENVKVDRPFWLQNLGRTILFAVELALLIMAPFFALLGSEFYQDKKKQKIRTKALEERKEIYGEENQ